MNKHHETVSCSICQQQDTKIELVASDWLHGSKEMFQLVKCQNCSLVYINPRPNQDIIGKYYHANSYYAYRVGATPHIRDEHKRLAKKLTKKRGEPGKLLDIGCGDGSFLCAMAQEGWQVTGTEIHKNTAHALQAQGLNVHIGSIETISLKREQYDLITLLEVLEHVHEPQATLKQIYSLLKPGGMLFLTVPNIDSLEYKLFKEKWVALEPPLHLYHFSPSTLHRLLAQNNFSQIELSTSASVAGLTRSLWLMLWQQQLAASSDISDQPTKSWRGRIHSILNVILAPVGFVLRVLRKGPGLHAYAYRL